MASRLERHVELKDWLTIHGDGLEVYVRNNGIGIKYSTPRTDPVPFDEVERKLQNEIIKLKDSYERNVKRKIEELMKPENAREGP